MKRRSYRTLAIPYFTQIGSGLIANVAEVLDLGRFDLKKVAVITGSGPSLELGQSVFTQFGSAGAQLVILPADEPTLKLAHRIGDTLTFEGITAIVGVGGGRSIDIAKRVGSIADVDVVSVPTALANDGFGSPIVSLTDGSGVRRSIGNSMPAGIIVDVEVVMKAPAVTLRAGLGDLVSNLTAVLDWRRAASLHAEPFDAASAAMAEKAAESVLDIGGLSTASDVAVLAEGLVLSGLAMALAGTSRPCSGPEHLIGHALDELLGSSARMHGEQVAVGTLAALEALGQDSTPIAKVFERCGVPTCPSDIGVSDATMISAVMLGPSLRPDRRTVLDTISHNRTAAARLLNRAFREAAAA